MKIKINSFLAGSLLVFVILLITNYKTSAFHSNGLPLKASQDRMIVIKSDINLPVKILKVKTKKGEFKSEKPYLDNDNWLEGLTVLLNNVSGKDVTYIGVEILFRRPKDTASEPPGVWHLEYGEDPFLYETGEPIPAIKVKPIKNGDTFEVTLNDHDFDRLNTFLEDIKYSVVSTIELRVNVIGFSDGTAWLGRMMRRDPTSPYGWSDIEPPAANSSSSFFLISSRDSNITRAANGLLCRHQAMPQRSASYLTNHPKERNSNGRNSLMWE